MTYWRTITFIIGILFSFATFSPGQTSGNDLPVINKELLQQDFKTFQTQLEKIHPALYRYKSSREISALMDSCYLLVNNPMTTIEFYKKIKFVLSAIQDGHLASDIPDVMVDYVEKKAKVFPLKLTFNKNKVYVVCHKDNLIPAGSEVVSINNEPIQKIRRALYQYIVSDGAIETNKAWVLNNSFWFYYLLVYGEKPSFIIHYKHNSAEIEKKSVPSALRNNIDCGPNHPVKDKQLQLTYKPHNTALLTIKTFNHQELEESKEDFTTFLKTSFEKIKEKKLNT